MLVWFQGENEEPYVFFVMHVLSTYCQETSIDLLRSLPPINQMKRVNQTLITRGLNVRTAIPGPRLFG